MTADLVIGLDLGTTNTKAIALNQDGTIVATASSGHALHSPQAGWAEQDGVDVWNSAVAALRLLAGKITLGDVTGLCLSGAMHSMLPVGSANQPLAHAVTWADQRAQSEVPRLRSVGDTRALYQETGCPLQALYHPAKISWWSTNQPDIFASAARFVAIKDFVLFNLVGEWVTDQGIASGSGLLDIRRCVWSPKALGLAGIKPERLPQLVSPFTVVGGLSAEAAQLTGFPKGLPVVAGSSDGALANLGTGAFHPGDTVITVGTSGALRRIMPEPYLDEQERTWCYLLADQLWFSGGAINNAGLAVQWVREKLYPDLSGEAGYNQLFQDAAGLPAGSGGVFFLPYFTGERNPHWDANARAMIYGLGLEHSRGHIARAVLEGVALCLADVWDVLDTPIPPILPVRLTGGITQSTAWAQVLCDVLGIPLAIVEAGDASAVGAGIVGYSARASQSSPEQVAGVFAARIQPGVFLQPDIEKHGLYLQIKAKFRSLYPHQH